MIIIRDWVATVPEEDKSVAYVGEHQTVLKEFLLTGSNWEEYKGWGFHLDMAFDLTTVTNREERKLEKTQISNTENITDTQVKTTGTTTKESYTVTDVDVDCSSPTDIAPLIATVREDGILLTWEILRQYTQLPGKLTATLRALGPSGRVKKSDMMVLEVEPAVTATQAAEITQSEFEVMEEAMSRMLSTTASHVIDAQLYKEGAEEFYDKVKSEAFQVSKRANEVAAASKAATQAEETALGVRDMIKGAFDHYPSNNRLNLEEVTYGRGVDKAGNTGTSDEYDISMTGYIPVKEGDVLSYQYTNPETGLREYGDYFSLCLYYDDKRVNKEANTFTGDENGELSTITVPAGVSYVRLTLYDLTTAIDPAIANTEELVPYMPYYGIYQLKKDAYVPEDMQEKLQAVQYVAQTLTDQQKAQARENIGIVVDEVLSDISTNPVQNKAVAKVINNIGATANRAYTGMEYLRTQFTTMETQMGDVDTALDSIIAIQESLIGGDGE